MRTLWLAPLILTGCLSHERSPDAASADAGSTDATAPIDAPLPVADAACVPDTPAGVSFDPGLPMGRSIALVGIDAEPAVRGVRVHLDGCGGGCPFDLVVSDVGDGLAGLGGLDAGAMGTLDTDGSSYAALSVVDARRCAGCGGTLDLLVGNLATGRHPELAIAPAAVDCSTGCGEIRAISIAAQASSITASESAADVLAPPLLAHVSSGYVAPCVICDCALPDIPATGIAAAFTGIFAPPP